MCIKLYVCNLHMHECMFVYVGAYVLYVFIYLTDIYVRLCSIGMNVNTICRDLYCLYTVQ